MNPLLLDLLMCPASRQPLVLKDAVTDAGGAIVSGTLHTAKAPHHSYPVINGVPRFVPETAPLRRSVDHFGDQWNHLNFDRYKFNWRKHIVQQTFGNESYYHGKTVVDAGAGSGMMTRWIAEAGAKHVIALELSHSVDDVMQRNLHGLPNVSIVQCTIDNIPLRDDCIHGLVGCTNVIQHTPSVEDTARELWRIVAPGSELAFNCYIRDDSTWLTRIRHRFYSAVRGVVSRLPYGGILAYAYLMSALRLVPVVGVLVEKADLMRQGEVEPGGNQLLKKFRIGVMNTLDYFGSHSYQHHKSFEELQALADELQPDRRKQPNRTAFFVRPQPPGIMLRVGK